MLGVHIDELDDICPILGAQVLVVLSVPVLHIFQLLENRFLERHGIVVPLCALPLSCARGCELFCIMVEALSNAIA